MIVYVSNKSLTDKLHVEAIYCTSYVEISFCFSLAVLRPGTEVVFQHWWPAARNSVSLTPKGYGNHIVPHTC